MYMHIYICIYIHKYMYIQIDIWVPSLGERGGAAVRRVFDHLSLHIHYIYI